MDYDLKITGGTIVDGTGAPGRIGDVGIKDGRIVALGAAPGAAARTIDATGRVVCPGFIDVHTHYDAQVVWDRMLTISPWHGVTTVVMGNCGFGVAPTRPQHRDLIVRTLEKVEGMSVDALYAGLGKDWPFETFPQYLDVVEQRGTAINVGVLVGHTPIRLYVMGEAATERPATETEIAAMQGMVREALAAGALGFATSHSLHHIGYGGKPVPSRMSTVSEVEALASEIGAAGHGMMQIASGNLPLATLGEIAAANRTRVSWTALLAGRPRDGVDHREQLARCRALIEQGRHVIPQVTQRPLNIEVQMKEPFSFNTMPEFSKVLAADDAGKTRFYADPAFRAEAKAGLPKASDEMRTCFASTVIAEYLPDPSLAERKLYDVAAERGVDPFDLLFDMALASNLEARFRMSITNSNEDMVAELMTEPHVTVLGLSDAGAHTSQLCDACQATDLLGRWVREKQAMPVEQAVYMLTARPAEVFGITDRGRLAVGLAADLVVFDLETVGAGPLRRIYDLPGKADRLVSEAAGIDAVIVNGTVLRQHGKDMVAADGALPGRLLRHGKAA